MNINWKTVAIGAILAFLIGAAVYVGLAEALTPDIVIGGEKVDGDDAAAAFEETLCATEKEYDLAPSEFCD